MSSKFIGATVMEEYFIVYKPSFLPCFLVRILAHMSRSINEFLHVQPVILGNSVTCDKAVTPQTTDFRLASMTFGLLCQQMSKLIASN